MNQLLLAFLLFQFYLIYRKSKELNHIYTYVMRFTNYANELLERIKKLDDRIIKLEKKKASHGN